NTGSVHAGFTAQAQHILQWRDTQTSRRALRGADEGPVNSIVAAAEIGLDIAPFMLGSAGMPPTLNRIVIVRSGVYHLSGATMRQIHVGAFIAETEFQNRHSRNLQAVT